MATKALLYSPDRLSFEKTKDSRCKSLVRQLLAIEIGRRTYQRVTAKAAEVIPAGRLNSSEESSHSESTRMGKLRWEPPKNKRPLKAHPWQNLNPISDQRSNPAY
jgi:hypothetical protein